MGPAIDILMGLDGSPNGPAGDIVRAAKALTVDQRKLLLLLPIDTCDFNFVSINWLASASKLDRKRARVVIRQLARKGLAEYRKGLFTEDGKVAGAGYGITAMGKTVAEIEEGTI